jgi:hypothetical protein
MPYLWSFGLFSFWNIKPSGYSERKAFGKSRSLEVWMFESGSQHAHAGICVAGHNIVAGATEASGGFKNRHRIEFCVACGIFKQPNAVGRFVGARNDEVEISIAISIAWNGPSPEANAEVDIKLRVVVRKEFEI